MIIKVFLQNEKNSRIRARYNEKTLELLKSDELLSTAEFQYGFIPGTLGEDGDCLDVWFISQKNYQTGTILEGRVIGGLEMFEEYRGEKENDIKIFVCPADEDGQLNDETVQKIKDFTLEIFKKFPEVKVCFGETFSPEETVRLLTEGEEG